MKKLVSVLLVLALALALTGTAMASGEFKEGDRVEFTRNTVAYKDHRNSAKTGAIVRKGSFSVVKSTYGDKWVELYVDSIDDNITLWFKVDNLKKTDKRLEVHTGEMDLITDAFICYCSGGSGKSSPALGPWKDGGKKWLSDGGHRISSNAYKHVKAKATVWLHREPSLKKSRGRALYKGEKVTYLRQWALDSRFVPFLNVRYKGESLWVSMRYVQIVK